MKCDTLDKIIFEIFILLKSMNLNFWGHILILKVIFFGEIYLYSMIC
jgi:hypothetical protein